MIRMTTPIVAVAVALFLGACADSGDTPEGGENGGVATEQMTTDAMPPQPGDQAPGMGGAPGGMQALVMEYQQIQQRLGQVQQQAIADPTLAAQQETLRVHVEAVLAEKDPEYEQKQGRLESLQQEMQAAQQSGNQEDMQRIASQGSALQMELQALQAGAVENEDIAQEVDEFREAVRAKMTEIDPEVPKLADRAEAIAAQLQGPQSPPAGTEAPATPADG